MNAQETLARRTANWLARQSRKVLPEQRSEWADAMSGELDYIAGDFTALHWALGFLLASCFERVRVMNPRNLHLPRWLLSMEMLLCFVPLTFFTVVLIVASLNGTMPIQTAVLNLSVAAVGPIGLLVAFRMIVLKRTTISRSMSVLLCLLAAWTLLAFVLLVIGGSGSVSEWWRQFVLIALLPAIGCVHLLLIGSRAKNGPALN